MEQILKAGTKIQIYNNNGNIAQRFEIAAVGNKNDKMYNIKPKISKGSLTLDVFGGTMNQNEKVQTLVVNGQNAQRFYFEKVEAVNKPDYIEAKAEYSADGKYLTKAIDQEGKEVKYEYNTGTGTTTKVLDTDNKATNYTYDILNKVTSVNKTAGGKNYKNEYIYDGDKLKTIKHNGMEYSFIYDAFGNQKQVKVGNQILITNNFKGRNGILDNSVYGNGQKVSSEYDRFDRVTKKIATNGTFTYGYNAKGDLASVLDTLNNETERYTYDLSGRIVKIDNTNGYKKEIGYDQNSNANNTKYILGTQTETVNYNYNRDNGLNFVEYNGGSSILINNYDSLGRVKTKELKANGKIYKTEYKFKNTNIQNKTTTILESMKNGSEEELKYTYNKQGNIETITKGNNLLAKHFYDELGQLIRENNKQQAKTILYSYDLGGNLQNKKEFSYTETDQASTEIKNTAYEYGDTNWKDKLTKFDGKEIKYDAIGNPTSYNGNTYTWQNGRQLASINQNIAYKYNDSGIRTEKNISGVVTKYYLNGNKVMFEKTGGKIASYQYDETGNIIGMKVDNVQYWYQKNGQNDIIGILNTHLDIIARYTYDSWGNILSMKNNKNEDVSSDKTHIANVNPYRYRSYRYDTETKLYYLQSRYYNPEMGRFINADALLGMNKDIVSYNVYIYVSNNPIMFIDINGYEKTYVLYYSNPESGFTDQVYNAKYFNVEDENVVIKPILHAYEFEDEWNKLPDEIDNLYIYMHGDKEILYFYEGGKMPVTEIKSMPVKKVKNETKLFSCGGGTGKNSVAKAFSKITKSKVVANTGGVSYSKINGKYLARKAFDLGFWKTFKYNIELNFQGGGSMGSR